MQVKKAFTWERSFSAIPGGVDIPAGAPVEYSEKNKQHYVTPTFFTGAIIRHDAIHYGCRVAADNVE